MIHRLAPALAVILAAAIGAEARAGGWDGTPFAAVHDAAKAGDKTAQLELGGRYESGRGGAPCDAKLARRWYSRAARSDGGDRLAYSAPVGEEKAGRFVAVGGGTVAPGLPEAAHRLEMLRKRRAHGFQCLAAPPTPVGVAAKEKPPLVELIQRFLAYSRSRPTYDGLVTFVAPMDNDLPKTLETFTWFRASKIGNIDGLFAYNTIECLGGWGRRLTDAAPRGLCATAVSVALYRFRIASPEINCLKHDELEKFLITNGWQHSSSLPIIAEKNPYVITNPSIIPDIDNFVDQFGGLVVIPRKSSICLTDLELYRPLD